MADIRHIAQLAKVSPATVSRVLNGHPHVSEATRKRVLSIVEQENYHPNALAANLRRQASDTIGYLQFGRPQLADSRMAQAAEKVLFEAGFKTFLCNADGDEKRVAFYLDEMIGRRVAGMILCPQGHEGRAFKAAQRLQQAGTATLILSDQASGSGISSVASDRLQGWLIGFQHLLELGHQRIAVLGQREVEMPPLPALPEPIRQLVSAHLVAALQQDVRALFKSSHSRPSALFCANEQLTIETARVLDHLNIQVPQQISLLGFSDTDFGRMIYPSLTSVRLPVEDLGLCCAEQLLTFIRNSQSPARSVQFEYQLQQGNSTARPVQALQIPFQPLGSA